MARNKPQYIIVHHTAVSRFLNDDQFKATKNYHIGKGWGDIGYHYEISGSGRLYHGRPEKKAGAHCYQQGMNYKSIGVCLDGNFDQEYPSPQQTKTLKKLLLDLMKRYDIPAKNILPHRHFATYKSCFGKNLPDNWAQALVGEGEFYKSFAKKWEGKFILDVDDKGKVYYIFNGKRLYVNPKWNMREFVINLGLQTGFKHEDVLRIPEGE